jgi:hypothetical protein
MHRLLDKGLEQLTAVVFKMGEVAQKALTISMVLHTGKRHCEDGMNSLKSL